MSNFSKHQELAIWALRYIKGSEAVRDYFQFQKANADFSGEELQQLKEDPIEYFYRHLSEIDAAITWIEGQE